MSNESHVADLALWYVGGVLTSEERDAVRVHLQTCAACRQAIDDARAVLGALPAVAEPVTPSAQLKQRLLARIDQEAEAAPSPKQTRVNRQASSVAGVLSWWRAWSPALALVGLAAVLLLVGWNLVLQNQLGQIQGELGNIIAPSARVANLPPTGQAPAGAGARLYHQPTGTEALLVVYGLKPLGSDKTYEFWLIRGGHAVAAGLFQVDASGSGRLQVHSGTPIGGYDQGGITIENAGGSDTPDMNSLVVAGSLQ